MMVDHDEISFVIPGYTPETMPLTRLIEYLQQMSVVLGDPDNLHLIAINEGSVAPVLHAPKAIALQANERAARVARGDGTRRQITAYHTIGRMLRRDSRDDDKPAVLRHKSKVILEIPAAPTESGELSGIRQFSTIDGQLIRIGGAGEGENATLQMQDLEGRVVAGITAKRTLAKELASLLWEPIRLAGIALWNRDAEGSWALGRMQVQSFERLDEDDAFVTLAKMRDLEVAWPEGYDESCIEGREASL